ncbi:MAG: aldo/keto reductase [Desulfobacteraceae bacterium]|nr:MAG: aldo/keto reductase [Desulfobacteraceae bacterium]
MGSLLAAQAAASLPAESRPAPRKLEGQVPARPFGKSGRQVSMLALGGMFDIAANQLMLRQAIQWGVTYWDTADCYHSGSEAGIGKYFARYPQDREKIFLVTKSDERNPEGISRLLNRSLERMHTSTIDLYFIHAVSRIEELDDNIRRWAEKAKADNQIRLFGFSAHRNMAQLLKEAAKLDWIDGIMMTYNFRNMHSAEMQSAVAACVQAGIGLTAMKTQAGGSWFDWSKSDRSARELAEQLKQKGWTEEQARLKAVWQNPHIASICSQMDSMRLLKANVEAAVDPMPLGAKEVGLLQEYACASADQYCIGCGKCETAAGVPISDIMRYHMYGRSYGRTDWARQHFTALPAKIREQLASIDFSAAEARCPQGLPIGRLMRKAHEDYA